MMQGIRHQKHETRKSRIFLFALAFILGFLFSPISSKASVNSFEKAFSKTIKYPAFNSEDKVEGIVWVRMVVDENGTMNIVQSNHACCQKLYDKVVEQLDGKKLKNFGETMTGLHHVKMIFIIK